MFSVCFICIAMTLVRFLREMDLPGTIFLSCRFFTHLLAGLVCLWRIKCKVLDCNS